jgi:hypothetical protein
MNFNIMNVSFHFKISRMNKIVLFLLSFSLVISACDKNVKHPLDYTVTNDATDSAMVDYFIIDSGVNTIPVKVKFLTGYQYDQVKLVFNGMPAGLTVTPDTFSAIPTYSKDFAFKTNNLALGTYPISVTSYTETRTPQTIYFNLHVVPTDCASLFIGHMSFTNVCNTRSYNNGSTGVATGTKNILTINNFAGYGPTVNVKVILDPTTGNLIIPLADYGNGAKLQGWGTFTLNTMTIEYDAVSTPTTGAEHCTVTYSK